MFLPTYIKTKSSFITWEIFFNWYKHNWFERNCILSFPFSQVWSFFFHSTLFFVCVCNTLHNYDLRPSYIPLLYIFLNCQICFTCKNIPPVWMSAKLYICYWSMYIVVSDIKKKAIGNFMTCNEKNPSNAYSWPSVKLPLK